MSNLTTLGWLIVLLAALTSALPANAQAVCKVVNYSATYPKTGTVGAVITLSTRVTFYCAQTQDSSWTVRVELTEPVTGSTVSAGSNTVTSNHPSVTVTVMNMVQAPDRTGNWFLRLRIYVIGERSHHTVATDTGSISIQLQPASRTLVSVTSTTSTSSTEVLQSSTTKTSSISTSQAESTTSTWTITRPPSNGLLLGQGVLAVIFLVAAAFLMLSRYLRSR
jgi:hypothetical protein